MGVNFLYTTVTGRMILKIVHKTNILALAAIVMRSPVSKVAIKRYIRKNNINMDDFEGQKYGCFADFFSRKRDKNVFDENKDTVISPCDGLLSVFPIGEGTKLYIKNSYYDVNDLIPDKEVAEGFKDGYCFIYRLRASDYHHFCYIDDCYHSAKHFIPGMVHSVQPIACEKEPVYRLNRRQWSILETEHFGQVAQIEVGALLVGGMVHVRNEAYVSKGQEMGYFELAGSTIVQLFTKEFRDKVQLFDRYSVAVGGIEEVEVKQGQAIGVI